jgi:acetyl-CoA synthetase
MAFGTDVGRGTRICWYTDIGWMMGPWLIYGALINGATICIYDGAPDYPTPDPHVGILRKAQGRGSLGILADAGYERLSRLRRRSAEEARPSSPACFASTGEPWNPRRGGGFLKRSAISNCRSSTTPAARRSRAAS